MEKLNFQHSLFQSSVSHDTINIENRCAAQYFCGNHDTFFFSPGYFDEQKVKNNSIYLLFTVTFD